MGQPRGEPATSYMSSLALICQIDVLTYNSVKDAIPAEWRHLLKQVTVIRDAISAAEGPYLVTSANHSRPLSMLTNQIVYSRLLKEKSIEPTCVDKWSSVYTANLQWTHIFELAFAVTRCTRLQTLQYKILHRIYPCNYWVSKWEPNTNETCMNCNIPDTIQHFFYHCSNVQPLWTHFKNWWEVNMQEQIELTEIDIIFGKIPVTKENKSLNLCILLAKQYIDRQKYINNVCSLYGLLLKIKHFISLEHYICRRNETMERFIESYEKLKEALG